MGRKKPTHSDKRENKQVQHVSSVSSDQPCEEPTRDAALSPWMCPPAVAQRRADVCFPVFSSCVTSQVHISFPNNGTQSADASPRVRDVLLSAHEVQVPVAVSTIDRRSISRLAFRLAVCHLKEDTCVAHRTRRHQGLQKSFHQTR